MAVVWRPRVNYTTVEKQLEHVQRLACLYITGAVRTTPMIALQIDHRYNSIGCTHKQEAMLSCFRLQVNAQWVSSACSHTRIKNILQQIVSVSHKHLADRIE